jgi:NitT/TauT family transport system substrate-binding protein
MNTEECRISRRRLLGAAGLAASGPALLAACTGGAAGGDGGGGAPGGRVDRVTTMTGFGETAREVFQQVADVRGFYAEAGIEIESIQAGAGGDTNHTALAGGQVDFMIADSSGALTRYVNGEDDTFQVLAAIHQLFPMALLGYQDQGIFRPRDLNGRTIGIAAGTIAERLWPVYLAETPGLDPDSIEVIPTSPRTQVQELVSGQLDAIALFSVSAPSLVAAGGGRTVTPLPWSDVFQDLYGNALITTRRMCAEQPDLVGRFTRATLRGLEYTLDHPEEAAAILVDAFPEQNAEVAAEEIRQLRDFCYGGLAPNQPLGHIDEERVVRQLRELSSLGEIREDFNPAMAPPDGDGTEGVINFRFVPGAGS